MFQSIQNLVLIVKVKPGTDLDKVKEKIETIAGCYLTNDEFTFTLKVDVPSCKSAKFVLVIGSKETLETIFKCKFSPINETKNLNANSYTILKWEQIGVIPVSPTLADAGVSEINLQKSITLVK